MPHIKCVIFDLDGVLTETSKQHFQAWQALAKKEGIDLKPEFEEKLKGVSREVSLDRILNLNEKHYSNDEKARMRNEKNQHYQRLIENFDISNLFEGALDLLNYLKAKDIKIALGSASKNAKMIINALGIEPYFDLIVDPSDKLSKPAPNIFLAPLEPFNLKPGECIGIEDAHVGIEAIKKAGMKAIGIGATRNLPNADICFQHIKDVLPYIKTLV